jgi:putative membrane protein
MAEGLVRRYCGGLPGISADCQYVDRPRRKCTPELLPFANIHVTRNRRHVRTSYDEPVDTAQNNDDDGRRVLARRVLRGGSEPDPRFTLANERTFLAWIRTSLALMAGGIAVEAFTTDLFVPQLRTTLAVLLLLLAMIISSVACFRWLNVERAMRHGTPLPLPFLAPLLALCGSVVAAVVVVFVLVRGA